MAKKSSGDAKRASNTILGLIDTLFPWESLKSGNSREEKKKILGFLLEFCQDPEKMKVETENEELVKRKFEEEYKKLNSSARKKFINELKLQIPRKIELCKNIGVPIRRL